MASKQTKNPNPVQTIEITNFGGRLTRILNGDMNSGFAKFANSWGYDPFSKPMNLTWFEQPVDITGPITDLIVAAKKFYGHGGGVNFGTTQEFVALLGNGNSTTAGNGNPGHIYIMQPAQISPVSSIIANKDSVIGIASVTGQFSFGGSMEIFGHPSVAGISNGVYFYIGQDTGITTLPVSSIGGAQAIVPQSTNLGGTISSGGFGFHPIKVFQGLLRVGNANTIATIGSGGTFTSLYFASIRGTPNSPSDLQSPLPIDSQIQDMEVSIDGNYLLLATSKVDNQTPGAQFTDYMNASAGDSVLYGWNGSDPNITTETSMPSVSLTALQTYLGNNMFFSNDSFGGSVSDGINKILTLSNIASPLPNATAANTNFLSWISPEYIPSNGTRVSSMFYFGGLDQENPPGLYRVMQLGEIGAGVTYSCPMNVMVDNNYTTGNSSILGTNTIGYGKHYFSVSIPGSLGNLFKLYRFLITSTGTGTAQFGTYETQTQIFSKKITVKQIRVYTEPTVLNNEIQIVPVGSDGTPITSQSFVYTYAAGTDVTQLQGSLERIDFNPSMKPVYALGLRINNLGIVNMTIKKIEIDYDFSGK